MALTCLDLFSGIGGFALGLHSVGIHTTAFCEIGEYQRSVLAKHWPDVPIYEDVRELHGRRGQWDVICGGFPCQDISVAGKGAGLAGARSGLWHEYRRLIAEVQPRYVVVENVAALRSRGLETALWGLYALGYDAEWHCIPASALGAPHRRDRIWIVAYPHSAGLEIVLDGSARERATPIGTSQWAVEPDVGRVAYGVPDRVDRLEGLGNAVVPQIPELIGHMMLRHYARQADLHNL